MMKGGASGIETILTLAFAAIVIYMVILAIGG
jgi:hypothetical protein